MVLTWRRLCDVFRVVIGWLDIDRVSAGYILTNYVTLAGGTGWCGGFQVWCDLKVQYLYGFK